jgi:hypothetical protein
MTDSELDDLLQPPATPTGGGLNQRVWRRTAGVLRRRVWRRRILVAGAIAASFVGGLALSFRPATLHTSESTVIVKETLKPSTGETFVSLTDLEQQAELADTGERARLYFLAGQRYGAERGDWSAALRCYKQALDAAPQAAEQIDPKTDDWLLMALKIERQKE